MESPERKALVWEIREYEERYPVEGGERLGAFRASRKAAQAKRMYVPFLSSTLCL